MPLVTLIGVKLAKENEEFLYLGPLNNCRDCKLKTVCFNLKMGREYQIVKIRDKRHNCSVHDGSVVVVEVQEKPIISCIPSKITQGSTVTIKKSSCKSIGCEYFDFCMNPGIIDNKKYTAIKILETFHCPMDDTKFTKAELVESD